MSELTHYPMSIFANIGATGPSGEGYLAVFGSAKSGSKSFSSNPTTIQSLAYWDTGLKSALINGSPPAIQEMDAIINVLTQCCVLLDQWGYGKSSTDQIYYSGSIQSARYICRTDEIAFGAATYSDFLKMLYRSQTDISANNTRLEWASYVMQSAYTGQYLPSASSKNKGEIKLIVNAYSFSRTFIVEDSGTINGSASYDLAADSYMMVMSDGIEWKIINIGEKV